MFRFTPALGLALASSILAATPARAWSHKEHIQLTRIAAQRLIADPNTPPDMKQWLKAANRGALDEDGEKRFFLYQRIGFFPHNCDGLGFWATVPDQDKGSSAGGGGSGGQRQAATIEPFGLPESQLHFVDLEFFHPDPAAHTFKDDLSHKPKLTDFPRDMSDPRWKQAGMLPFRTEDVYKKMLADLKAGKLADKPGQYPRDEHAEKWAGYLAHYLEDSTQPQHSTIDYKSRTYFGKGNVRSPNVHWDVEGRLMDDEYNDYMPLREEFWAIFVKALDDVQDPADETDLWTATLQVQLKSYDALPMIGRAAMAAYKIGGTPENPTGHPTETFDADAFFHFKGTYDGREMTVLEMKARQMAWAVKRIEKAWRRGWDEARGK